MKPRPLTPHAARVVETVAIERGVPLEAIMDPANGRKYTALRHRVMYDLRSELLPCGKFRFPLTVIGWFFGVDHTVALYGIRKHAIAHHGGVMPSEARGKAVQRVLVAKVRTPTADTSWPSNAALRRNRVGWSDTEVTRALKLKDQGYTLDHIAGALGRTKKALRSKLRAEFEGYAPATQPDEKDQRHVAACLAQGGFPAWDEKRIGIDRLGRRQMAVCPPLIYPQRQFERAA